MNTILRQPPENRNAALGEKSGGPYEKHLTATQADSVNSDDLPEPLKLWQSPEPDDQLFLEIRRVVLQAILHNEERSFAEVAEELGCTKAAISKVYLAVLDRLGWHSQFKRVGNRVTRAEIMRAKWAAGKGPKARAAVKGQPSP